MIACNETTNAAFNWRCICPRHHTGDCLDHADTCPSCDRTVDPSTLFGPAEPARLDGGTAVLHRLCAEELAGERAGGLRVVA